MPTDRRYPRLKHQHTASDITDLTTALDSTYVRLDSSGSTGSVTSRPVPLRDVQVFEFPTDYRIDDINKQTGINSTNGESGVLIDAAAAGYFDLVLPFMVVIGDSIAEGHPDLHGRLHPSGSSGFTSGYASRPGQLSYELSCIYNMPVLNHGIGSQTSTQVRDRWSRDVLAMTSDPGDGRGSSTINTAGEKPYAVYLHVGVNDVTGATTLATTQSNFNFFAQSCRDNNIILIVSNIGPASDFTAQQITDATALNAWLEGGFLTTNPEVTLVDYLDWGTGGTDVYTDLRTNAFRDTIHPNMSGYAEYARYIRDNVAQNLSLRSIFLNSSLDGTSLPNRFARITKFTFNGNNYAIKGDEATFELTRLANPDTPVVRLTPTEVQNVTATTSDAYTGFAEIKANLARTNEDGVFAPEVVTPPPPTSKFVAAGVFLSGALSLATDYHAFGIASISTTDSANGNVTVTLNNTASLIAVQMIGSSNGQISPRWSSGAIPTGQTAWTINFRRTDTNAVVTSTSDYNFQLVAYNFL